MLYCVYFTAEEIMHCKHWRYNKLADMYVANIIVYISKTCNDNPYLSLTFHANKQNILAHRHTPDPLTAEFQKTIQEKCCEIL